MMCDRQFLKICQWLQFFVNVNAVPRRATDLTIVDCSTWSMDAKFLNYCRKEFERLCNLCSYNTTTNTFIHHRLRVFKVGT